MAVIKDDKLRKKDCVVVFLGEVGAFDNIGHDYIIRLLKVRGVSPDIKNLIIPLVAINKIKISTGTNSISQINEFAKNPQVNLCCLRYSTWPVFTYL